VEKLAIAWMQYDENKKPLKKAGDCLKRLDWSCPSLTTSPFK